VRHLTCFYERLRPVGKEQKKEEQKKIEGVLK
jgi:hypothetical protein